MEDSSRPSRRQFLRWSALTTGALTLAACGAAPQTGSTTTEAPTESGAAGGTTDAPAPTTAAAQPGVQTIRVVSGQDVTELEVRQHIADEFNKANSNIKAEIVVVKGDRYDSQQVMIAGGNAPDVLYLNPGFLYAFASKDVLLPLDDFVAQEKYTFDGIYDVALEIGRYEGKLVAMPFEVAPLTIVYNKNLFDKAGVPYPTTDWADPNWTWDAFVNTAKQLTNVEDKQYGAQIDNWMWQTFVFQNGGSVLSNSKEITPDTRSTMDSPESVQAFQWLVDLRTTHNVHAPQAALAELGGFDRFMAGKVAMYVFGRWLNTFRTIKDFEWDVAALPHVADKEPKTLLLDLHYGIYSGSQAAGAAWEFLKYIVTEDPQTANVQTGMAVAALEKINTSPAFLLSKPPENEQVYVDALKYAVPEQVNAATTYSSLVDAELEGVFQGTRPVQEGLSAAAAAVNQVLDEVRADNA
jgi:multiple sugar transport system substrate-binding protein